MRAVCTIYFLLIFFCISVAQENPTNLLLQAENTIYSNPQEAIRIADYVSINSKNNLKLTQAAYLLARSYYIEGDYNNSLKIGLKYSEEKYQNADDDTQLKIDVFNAKILRKLRLNKLAEEYMNKAKFDSQNITNRNTLNWFQGKLIQNNINSNSEEDFQHIVNRLHKAKNEFQKIPIQEQSFQIGNINLEIATILIKEFELDSVPHYLNKAYEESKKEKAGNFLEMQSLLQYGNYLFLKKQHKDAIDSLKSGQSIALKFTNIPMQITLSEVIANNYLALNDIENFDLENERTQILKNTQADKENQAVNSVFNFVSDNEIKKLALAKSSLSYNALLFGSGLFLILVLWGSFSIRYRIKKREYQNFIDYFEKKQKLETSVPSKQKIVKLTVVPKEMEVTLLKKLNEFEKTTDFTKQDTSLSRLALQFDTNTKYLSEVVNFLKRKNFNSYINELRINYIIDKLKNDPHYLQYKISYLAEDSGFSSHSVFATTFKQATGIPPTSFITILKDKKEASVTNKDKNAS